MRVALVRAQGVVCPWVRLVTALWGAALGSAAPLWLVAGGVGRRHGFLGTRLWGGGSGRLGGHACVRVNLYIGATLSTRVMEKNFIRSFDRTIFRQKLVCTDVLYLFI